MRWRKPDCSQKSPADHGSQSTTVAGSGGAGMPCPVCNQTDPGDPDTRRRTRLGPPFENPIEVDGRKLVTLSDAGSLYSSG
jgi:hypothetical protein